MNFRDDRRVERKAGIENVQHRVIRLPVDRDGDRPGRVNDRVGNDFAEDDLGRRDIADGVAGAQVGDELLALMQRAGRVVDLEAPLRNAQKRGTAASRSRVSRTSSNAAVASTSSGPEQLEQRRSSPSPEA